VKKLLAALACGCLLLPSSAFADDAKKDATIRKLIAVTGATQMGSQLVANLFEQPRPASPAGQKRLAKMPAVMQESLQVGNEWGRRKAQELLEKLKDRGFEPVEA
jgi:hypothetical protein